MSQAQNRERKNRFSIILVVILSFVILLSQSSFISEMESRSWDWRLRLPNVLSKADQRIAMILLDQESLEYGVRHFGVYWPWPRQMYEAVIKYLETANAKAVAFDILFTEQTAQSLDDDKDFVNAVSGKLPVVTAVALSQDKTLELENDLNKFHVRQRDIVAKNTKAKVSPSESWPIYNFGTLPFIELLEASNHFGNVSAAPDSDGVFRHTVPISYFLDQPVLSLPLSLIIAGQGRNDLDLDPLRDNQGRLVINFSGQAGSYRSYHISDVIQSYANIQEGKEPIIAASEFADSFVFVGMTAPGLMDLKPSPVDARYPGVEINATIADNFLNDNFIRKIDSPIDWIIALVASILAALAIFFVSKVARQASLLFLLLTICVGIPLVATYYGYWIPLVLPTMTLILSFTLCFVSQYHYEGRQHKFIRNAFKHYVSPDVINQIVENPKILSLGGERRELTIFFSDIQGFTSIAEKLPATKISDLLNKFLSEMTTIILASGGTLDKYVGDAIVAFWNAPIPNENHATLAVNAAIQCQKRLQELQTEFERDFGTAIKMRIGIHTGMVNVGNFGSHERFAYTVVGDAANLASRLEGANKYFGTYTLISQTTRDQLNDSIALRRVATVRVVGRTEPITVYEPYDSKHLNDELRSSISSFEKALVLLESGDLDQALTHFQSLNSDQVAKAYIKRVSQLNLEGFEAGVWSLVEK